MTTWTRIFGLSAALAVGCGAAQAQDYPADLVRKHPAAYAAWAAAMPAAYRRIGWIARFQGVAAPMERVAVDGKAAVAGLVCKPHDCADNKVVFVIALDGSSVSGRVEATTTKPPRSGWGARTPERTRLLERLLRE